MRNVTFYDTERMLYTDLNAIPYHVFKFLHDSFAQSQYGGAEGFIGASFTPTRVGASTIQLAKGLGYQADASPSATEVDYGPLVNVADLEVTAPAAPSGNFRYDRYEIRLKTDEAFVQESREYRTSANDPVTSATTDTVVGYSFEGQWVQGTLGGSVPAATAGWLTVATVYQTDGVGIANASDVTDARSLLGTLFGQNQFTGILNNQSSAQDVTGLLLSSASTIAARIIGQISVSATASFSLGFSAMAWYDGSTWNIAPDLYETTMSGMLLSITAGGQVQYKSGNYSGFTGGVIKWRVLDVGV